MTSDAQSVCYLSLVTLSLSLNIFGRGDWIRTNDLSVPNRAHYQAVLRPDKTCHILRESMSPGQYIVPRKRSSKTDLTSTCVRKEAKKSSVGSIVEVPILGLLTCLLDPQELYSIVIAGIRDVNLDRHGLEAFSKCHPRPSKTRALLLVQITLCEVILKVVFEE